MPSVDHEFMIDPEAFLRTSLRVHMGHLPFERLPVEAKSLAGGWAAAQVLIEAERLGPLMHLITRGRRLATRDVEARFRLAYRQSRLRNRQLLQELAICLRVFADEHVPCLVLKGAALAERVYGDISLRPMRNLDICVRSQDLTVAYGILEHLGYQAAGVAGLQLGPMENDRQQLFVKPGGAPTCIALHGKLLDAHHDGDRNDPDWFWDTAERVQVAGERALVLGMEAQVLHLANHLATRRGGRGLIWYYEIAALLSREADALDWDELLSRAQRYHLRVPLGRVVVALAEKWDAVIPAAALSELRPRPLTNVARIRTGQLPWAGHAERAPLLSAICPTYKRPALLANAVACWEAQDYPLERRELIILDDAGQFDTQHGPGWFLASRSERFPSLWQKFDALVGMTQGEIIVVWEDDDVYLPHHLSAIAAAFERQRSREPDPSSAPMQILMPGRIYCNSWLPHGQVKEETQTIGHHGSWAYTRSLYQACGGYPADIGRLEGDTLLGQALRRHGEVVTYANAGPTYVYRWDPGAHPHASERGEDGFAALWQDLGRLPLERVGKLEPRFDEETRTLYETLAPRARSPVSRLSPDAALSRPDPPLVATEPSIFVQIASYRDPECQWTMKDLFAKAKHPDRIFVGICWQFDPKADQHCFVEPNPRPAQVRAVGFRAGDSRGVCWARTQAQGLYRGEDYVLMIDSHMRFIPHWDEVLIDELKRCASSKPLLSVGPPRYTPPDWLEEDARPAVQCLHPFDTEGDVRGYGRMLDAVPSSPLRGAFVAAAYVFARGRVIEEVPYDPHMYFNQEEISLAVRLFTHGWDVYHPSRIVVYHYYKHLDDRGNLRPLHWDDHPDWVSLEGRGRERLHHLVGFRKSTALEATVALDRFGLGSARSLTEFENWAGLDFSTLTATERARNGTFVLEMPDARRPLETNRSP